MTIDKIFDILSSKIYPLIDLSAIQTATSEGFLDSENPISIFTHSFNYDIPNHNHDFYELVYVHKGTHTFSIDDQSITLNEKIICILNKKAIHATKYIKEDS